MNNCEKVELILIFVEFNRSSRLASRVYADAYTDKFHSHHNVHIMSLGFYVEMITVNFLAIKTDNGCLDQIIYEDTSLQVMAYTSIRVYPQIGRYLTISKTLI